MSNFNSAYNRVSVPEMTSPGVLEDTIYELSKDSKGVEFLKPVGKRDVNAFLQASLEETKIYNILSQYLNGNESVLNRTVGQFVDVTHMPKSLAEANQVLIDVSNKFDNLPKDIRNTFDNDVSKFIDAMAVGGLSKFNEVFKLFKSMNVEKNNVVSNESEVVPDESK